MVTSDTALALDPFGYMVTYASAFKPLGGSDASPDPRYAFHTSYFPFRVGRVRFTIRITGLNANAGELFLQIHGFAPTSGRDPVLVTSSRMALTGQADPAEHVVDVRCVAGVTYAVYGYIPDADQISATAVEIFAEEEEDNGASDYLEELDGRSSFGTVDLDRPKDLVTGTSPSFAEPTSQCLTQNQLSEPACQQWRIRLPAKLAAEDGWAAAQMLQILQRYGMLHPGARGLALGDNGQLLAPILAQHGCDTVCYTLSNGQFDRVAPTVGDPETAGWTIDDEPPASLRGFDFLWSLQGIDTLTDYAQASRFVERGLRSLRQGGYAAFALHMVDRPHQSTGAGAGILTRREVERLALTQISRSHDVAQLNFAGDQFDSPRATGAVTPFILIVRRSLSAI